MQKCPELCFLSTAGCKVQAQILYFLFELLYASWENIMNKNDHMTGKILFYKNHLSPNKQAHAGPK